MKDSDSHIWRRNTFYFDFHFRIKRDILRSGFHPPTPVLVIWYLPSRIPRGRSCRVPPSRRSGRWVWASWCWWRSPGWWTGSSGCSRASTRRTPSCSCRRSSSPPSSCVSRYVDSRYHSSMPHTIVDDRWLEYRIHIGLCYSQFQTNICWKLNWVNPLLNLRLEQCKSWNNAAADEWRVDNSARSSASDRPRRFSAKIFHFRTLREFKITR